MSGLKGYSRSQSITEEERLQRVFNENKNDPKFAAQSLFYVIWRADEFEAIKFDNVCILMRTLCKAAGLSDKEINKYCDEAFVIHQKYEKEKGDPVETPETQPSTELI